MNLKGKILVSLMLACGTAQASEWLSLGKSTPGDEIFIDKSSIRGVGAIRRAWFKTVFVPHTTKQSDGPAANRWWSKSMQLIAFNCGEETARIESLTVYYEDGTNGTDPAASFPTPWTPVTPDTVMSGEIQVICAWKAK
jgi:hypothetical protein